jgi:hypothetical protein
MSHQTVLFQLGLFESYARGQRMIDLEVNTFTSPIVSAENYIQRLTTDRVYSRPQPAR